MHVLSLQASASALLQLAHVVMAALSAAKDDMVRSLSLDVGLVRGCGHIMVYLNKTIVRIHELKGNPLC